MVLLQLARAVIKASARSVVTALSCFVVATGAAGCTLPETQAEAASPANLITTTDLRQMLGNPKNLKGIEYNRAVGIAYQEVVLENLPGPKTLYSNTKRFESQARNNATKTRIKSVIPDGVTGASEGSPSSLPPFITTHPESTFVEVKALNGVLDLADGRYQILGMLDVLAKSPAASSTGPRRAYPSLYLIITADTALSTDIELRGRDLKVLVWVSWVEKLWTGRLQVTTPLCLNCNYILPNNASQTILIGPSFSPPKLGAPGSGGLDEPILDDRLVGSPGTPGDTSPNP